MEEVEVEILTQAITAQYGTLDPGVTRHFPAPFAAHLVEKCMAARYVSPATPASGALELLYTAAAAMEQPTASNVGVEMNLTMQPSSGVMPAVVLESNVQTSAQSDVTPVELVAPDGAAAVANAPASAGTDSESANPAAADGEAATRATRKRTAAAKKES